MNQTLHSLAAGATGALLVAAVVVGQPALAGVDAKTAAKNSVTSKSIKNATVQAKDLNADLNASLAKANSALQSVPDASVTTTKLADNAVTNPKMADNAVGSAEVAADSLAAADLAANSVGASELAANAVDGTNVQNGGLGLIDISDNQGFVNIDLPSLANGSCSTEDINTGTTILGGVVIVTLSFQFPNGLFVEGARPQNGAAGHISVHVCNRSGGVLDPGALPVFWGVLG